MWLLEIARALTANNCPMTGSRYINDHDLDSHWALKGTRRAFSWFRVSLLDSTCFLFFFITANLEQLLMHDRKNRHALNFPSLPIYLFLFLLIGFCVFGMILGYNCLSIFRVFKFKVKITRCSSCFFFKLHVNYFFFFFF